MYHVTVVIYPQGDAFHPVGKRLADDPSITRTALHAIKAVADGTIIMMTEVEGDLDRYREILATSREVRTFAVSGDETGYGYVQVESTPQTERLLERIQTHDFVVKMPIEYTADGGQRITMVGREADFARAPSEPPDPVEMELVSTGPYRPDTDDVFTGLTSRQREVLETAIRRGYYENPRRTTHEEIADVVGVEPGTVGKHLRNIESKVFSKYVL